MDFECFVLFLYKVNKVNAEEHLLLSKSVFEELLLGDARAVAEDSDHDCNSFLKEFLIVQILGIRIHILFVEVLSHCR